MSDLHHRSGRFQSLTATALCWILILGAPGPEAYAATAREIAGGEVLGGTPVVGPNLQATVPNLQIPELDVQAPLGSEFAVGNTLLPAAGVTPSATIGLAASAQTIASAQTSAAQIGTRRAADAESARLTAQAGGARAAAGPSTLRAAGEALNRAGGDTSALSRVVSWIFRERGAADAGAETAGRESSRHGLLSRFTGAAKKSEAPAVERRSFWEQIKSAGLVAAAVPLAAAPRRPLHELKQVLGDGAGGALGAYEFRDASGVIRRYARADGLEGFLYTKLELEREGRSDVTESQLRYYGAYLDRLFQNAPSQSARLAELKGVLSSDQPDSEKNAAFNATLTRIVAEGRSELSAADPSLWLRESGVYMIFSRAYNRLKPGKNFFDSLDAQELSRIRRETGTNTIWLLDVFEIGDINRWGTGGGSSYALKGYRFKESLGGTEAYLRFAARAKAMGFEVALDEVPNHASLDSDQMKTIPESFVHIVPPQPEPGESENDYRRRVLDPLPRDGKDPVFWLLKADNYPDGKGGRAPKWILAHHPSPDSGGLWLDMAQRDYTTQAARDWEIAQTRMLAERYGAKLVRRDMAYDDLNDRFHDRWKRMLSAERDRAPQGWVRDGYDSLIAAMDARYAAIKRSGDKEFLDEALDAARQAQPGLATAEEAYGNFAELSRAGATSIYNKIGLYDALVSRNPSWIRDQLTNVAFSSWRRGGAAMLNFIGTHDGGEGNPIDKFGDHIRAAAVMALMFRPILVFNGLEQGVGQRDNLIGDLAMSVDTAKAIPMDIPVLIDWAKSDPALKTFLQTLLGKSAEYASFFKTGAMEVLRPSDDNSGIVGWSVGSGIATGRVKAVIGVANVGGREDATRLRFDKAVLSAFGSFVPVAGRRYRLTDVVNPQADGTPTVYERDGRELAEKGLYVDLKAGGAHLFEVEELDESAPVTGPPAGSALADQIRRAGLVSAAVPLATGPLPGPEKSGLRAKVSAWLHAPWNVWVERLVYGALVPFFLLQAPQIINNLHNLAVDPSKVLILPWIGYATGILANSNLWGYHLEGKRNAVAFVQASGVVTSSFVLWQIFKAGLLAPSAASMPVVAAVLMAGLIATSVVVNGLKWMGWLPDKVWNVWKGFSKLAGLFALPLGFSVTFNLLATHPAGVLAASFGLVGLGLAAMLKERFGGLPKGVSGFWSRLGAWLGTLLFVFLPIPQLVNNIQHPERLAGIAVGTMVLSTVGNLLEATGAIQAKSQIWFVGSFWSVLVGGWSALLTMLLFGAINPLFFAAYTVGVVAWLSLAARNAKRFHGDKSYWKALRFSLFGDGAK